MSRFKAHVGADWGSFRHQAVLVDTAVNRSCQRDGAGLTIVRLILAGAGAAVVTFSAAIGFPGGPMVEAFA